MLTAMALSYQAARERRAQIARAVKRGMSIGDAAARFGVKKRHVYIACHEHGLRFGARGSVGAYAAMAQRRRAIARAASRDTSLRDLVKLFRVSPSGVRKSCGEAGVTLSRAPLPVRLRALEARQRLGSRPVAAARLIAGTAPDHRQALRLLIRTDLTLEEIGRRCGISRQRVHQIWERALAAGGLQPLPSPRPSRQRP